AGLPNLQTSMPQYSDYSDRQISDLAAYVHYLRQQRRYKELTSAKAAPGDANLGREYFNGAGNCRNCHSPETDLAGIARKLGSEALRARLLRPGAAFVSEAAAAGDLAHLKLLENYTGAQVENLIAYLETSR